MTTTTPLTIDIEDIARRRRSTESMASIAKDYGVTRERIRQILVSEYGTTWSDELNAEAATERENAIASWRAQLLDQLVAGTPITRDEVVNGCPTPVSTVEEVLGEFAWAVAFPQKSHSRYSDEEITASMKRVWEKHVKPDPLTREAYDKARDPKKDVSGARIAQRMPWSSACEMADVPAGTARRATYDRLPAEVALEWVAAFLAWAVKSGERGSAAEYDRWAKEVGGPSMGGVRAVTGSWNEARALAVPRVVKWQRAGGTKYPTPAESGTNQYPKADVTTWHEFRAAHPEMSMRELSEALGVAESTLRYHLEP
jgi:DNA-binding transcriptional MerR regulator